MSRFVRPETIVLTLDNGDQLTIRKRLTAGEQRAAYARLYQTGVDGRLINNMLDTGIALIEAYLLDWTLTDDDGRKVEIRPDPHRAPDLDTLRVVLDSLDYVSLVEIKDAIERHERAMQAARNAEKKTIPDGTIAPSPISESPDAAAGPLTTSETSIPTTTH
jgi:hypothetical protein